MSRDVFEHAPPSPAPTRDTEVAVRSLPDTERTLAATGERGHGRERESVERYRLSQDEAETLREVGRFRVVNAGDLERFRYAGDSNAMSQDLRSLRAQGLLQQRTLVDRGKKLRVVVLTKEGRNLLREDAEFNPNQAAYAGLVKPREAPHDAAIYRMYQAEAASIQARGGTVRRVVLDYELKRRTYAPLAKDRPHLDSDAYARRQAQVAAENGLEMVNGKIPLPDLRIEYETREGEMAKVDLELATDHYKASHSRRRPEPASLYTARAADRRRKTAISSRRFCRYDATATPPSLPSRISVTPSAKPRFCTRSRCTAVTFCDANTTSSQATIRAAAANASLNRSSRKATRCRCASVRQRSFCTCPHAPSTGRSAKRTAGIVAAINPSP